MMVQKVDRSTVIINGVKIKYNEEYVTIFNSYKVDGKRMRGILEGFRASTGYESKRSVGSWIREWRTHNFLYKLGLFREHTKNCDLEENVNLLFRIIYFILG